MLYNFAMKRRMQRRKREKQPKIPVNIDEAAQLLMQHSEYRYVSLSVSLPYASQHSHFIIQYYREAFDGGDFFLGRIQTADGGDALIFVSPKLLPAAAQTPELQADGTFRSVPEIFMQLFTLHISRFGQVIQPLE